MKKGTTGIDLIMMLMDENERLRSQAVALITQVLVLRRMVEDEDRQCYRKSCHGDISTAKIRAIFDWPEYRPEEDEEGEE